MDNNNTEPRNVLYHVKYTGGCGDPFVDFDVDHLDRLVVIIGAKQIAGHTTHACTFNLLCDDFADLRWSVSGRSITKSNLRQKDEDPHEFLIFVSYSSEEDVL